MTEPSETTAEAATLLLRSPRWSVSEVMELLEIGDVEFRRLIEADARLARVLAARQEGQVVIGLTERQCVVCGESFSTATYRNHCGAAACARVSKLNR
ncbi:MAG: hypothetical protein H6993_01530 [Pseudomonadales bacterium]|nr:hypothetical protein [Pseudomonadales bacterium]MCP5182607.1 hypothetical protein [Pseudomonadales bacterium]